MNNLFGYPNKTEKKLHKYEAGFAQIQFGAATWQTLITTLERIT